MKLPFVWELKDKQVISHIVGSPHGIQIDFRKYVPDLFRYLNEKGCVLVEEPKAFGGLDALTEIVARERSMQIAGLATKEESNVFYNKYAFTLTENPAATMAFRKGDESEMRKLYLEKQGATRSQILKTCNQNMVERSLIHLRKTPSLILVDLAHLLIGPTLLKYYNDEGFEIKKI